MVAAWSRSSQARPLRIMLTCSLITVTFETVLRYHDLIIPAGLIYLSMGARFRSLRLGSRGQF
jgi:hypothetical protein